MKKLALVARKILPWAVALGIFIYLFSKYSPEKILASIKEVHLWLFLLLSFSYFCFATLVDSYALKWTLSRFVTKMTLREMIPPRLVTYLLAILNYNAGQLSLALHLKRTHGAPTFKTLGAFGIIMMIDLFLMVTFALGGSLFTNIYVDQLNISLWIQRFACFFYTSFFLFLAYWEGWLRFLPKKLNQKLYDWLSGRHLFMALHQASLKDYLRLALLRLPMHVAIILYIFIVFQTAQAYIPLKIIFSVIPMALLIGAIPITPGGLGTTQVAIVALLKDHVSSPLFALGQTSPENMLLGISLLWVFTNYFIKACVGTFYLKRVLQ